MYDRYDRVERQQGETIEQASERKKTWSECQDFDDVYNVILNKIKRGENEKFRRDSNL
jgi:hypothetical protein